MIMNAFTQHRETTPTALSGPRFPAPLHNFAPLPGPVAGPSEAGALDGGI